MHLRTTRLVHRLLYRSRRALRPDHALSATGNHASQPVHAPRHSLRPRHRRAPARLTRQRLRHKLLDELTRRSNRPRRTRHPLCQRLALRLQLIQHHHRRGRQRAKTSATRARLQPHRLRLHCRTHHNLVQQRHGKRPTPPRESTRQRQQPLSIIQLTLHRSRPRVNRAFIRTNNHPELFHRLATQLRRLTNRRRHRFRPLVQPHVHNPTLLGIRRTPLGRSTQPRSRRTPRITRLHGRHRPQQCGLRAGNRPHRLDWIEGRVRP